MLSNYLKLAYRNLLRQKFYTAINIVGLTLGITCCLLIFLFVKNELSYDRFHAQGDRIYRVLRVASINGDKAKIPYVSGPYAPALRNDFPGDVKAAVRVMSTNALFSYQDKTFKEDRVFITDPNFLEVFTFPLVQGDPRQVLADPNNVVISEAMAQKYFGSENPVGKLLTLDKTQTCKVSGVMANVPENSHLKFDFIFSIKDYEGQDWFQRWNNNAMFTYVLLAEQTNLQNLMAQFPAFMEKHQGAEAKKEGQRMTLDLQPLLAIHLDTNTQFDFAEQGNKSNVYIFSAIAVFILLIACINFMNLASARSAGRAREVGVRKVLGAYKQHLIGQFLSESTLLTFIAVALSFGLIILILPYFNAFTEKHLVIPFTSPGLYAFLVGITLVVGLLAGSYPAFFLSSFQPVKVLKGRLASSAGHPVLRKALVVAQFSLSIFLMIGTAVIFRQMDYVQHKNLGFSKEHIIRIPLDNSEIHDHRQAFMNRVKQLPGVQAVSVMSGEPGGFHDKYVFAVTDKPNETWSFRTAFSDVNYLPTLGIKLVAGRNFSKSFATDSVAAILLNETAVKNLGWTPQEALGKELVDPSHWAEQQVPRRRKVIGVVQDYHFSSLKEAIEPLVITMRRDHRLVAIRLAPGNPKPALAAIETVYKQLAASYPFQYTFLDESFDQLYKSEQKQAQILTVFAVLAIFIACLGLFGLALYSTEQRRKEIGIRKVLGASVGGLVTLLSQDFLKLVLLANVLAWPLAWWAMHQWLQDFTYRVELSAFIFIVAGIVALLIAIATVSLQALKVAVANPVNALRDE
ncbi:ABC transporter permease [Adhaeribacter radiodurans]|uniref:ABC transporter permease n=1 Tax=Adhaeribacter radiodurans TaxID=2745197 RepID=A0A7L7LEK7_9BACT|nr:ABC transporter permease [Adhaeribacter radiodurans]QMU31213.1 ABC transporter permease [Adhaeribacter radiodurans]